MYPNQAVINEHLDENVSIGDNDSFMEIFGGSLNEEVDQHHSKSGHDVDETLDAPLQAPNANDYSNARLIEELENKNARVSGFRDQDVSTLQKILDQEFEIEKESIIKNVREKREQAAKQAGLQRKRMLLEKHLREEISEIEKDHRIEFWLTLIKKNSTPHSGRIEANSITSRALAKVLWTNTSLTNLDLSRNGIDDQAGAYMARLLKRNTALKTICLGSNELGPIACRAFGDALCSNSTLRSLNLESNHLTCHGTNMSGLRVLADMFRKNKTLTSINMWRCALGEEAGEALSQGIESNQSITFLELGHNSLSMVDEHSIKTALDMNFKRFEELQMRRKNEQEMVDIISAKEKALQDQLRVERQLREWYMEQKQLRAEERREKEEKRFAEQVAQEEEAKRLLQERLEEEKKAEAARLSKKKKGNKKKKKGNKR